jgi:hypothetical protein
MHNCGERIQVRGWGDSKDYLGHIWIMSETHSTEEFIQESMDGVHLPGMRAAAQGVPRRFDGPEPKLFFCDGDMGQTKYLASAATKQVMQEMACSTMKQHRKISGFGQPNDTAKMQRSVKGAAKTSKVAHLADPRVWERARDAFQEEVKRLQMKFPRWQKKTTSKIKMWQPVPATIGRLERAVAVLQPAFRNYVEQHDLSRGWEEAGFDMSDKLELRVDLQRFMRNFPHFRKASPESVSTFLQRVEQLQSMITGKQLVKVPDQLMSVVGFMEIAEHKTRRLDPFKISGDERPLWEQRDFIFTRYDAQTYAEQQAKLKQERLQQQLEKKATAKAIVQAQRLEEKLRTNATYKRKHEATQNADLLLSLGADISKKSKIGAMRSIHLRSFECLLSACCHVCFLHRGCRRYRPHTEGDRLRL